MNKVGSPAANFAASQSRTTSSSSSSSRGDEDSYVMLIGGQKIEKAIVQGEQELMRRHVEALKIRRASIRVWYQDGDWRAVEQVSAYNIAERVSEKEYVEESEDLTARALAELASNPAFVQWQQQQQNSGVSRSAHKKTVLSRIGGALASMSPSKLRSSRARMGQATPVGKTLGTGTPSSSFNTTPADSRRFTSPRRFARIASPIDGTPLDRDTIRALTKDASPNSKRRLAFDQLD